MKKSQFFIDLQNRLTCLLQDPAFADTRFGRLSQHRGIVEDAIAAYNFAVSEEILRSRESSLSGVISPEVLSNFRKNLICYMEENGDAHDGYKEYIFIICEYLAMVAEKPLHPPAVRHLQSNPPKDTADRWYCAMKTEHIKEPDSLCRFCNSIAWP